MMRSNPIRYPRQQQFCAVLMLLVLFGPYLPAQQTDYAFHAETELVLVNVTVRDKTGKLVLDLKPEDFQIKEDGKPQKVVSFDVENTDAVPAMDVAQAKPFDASPAPAPNPGGPQAAAAIEFKDRRLIVLFFDLSGMEPDEIDHSVTAAENYVDKQMAPADLVSVVSLGSSLQVNQDFTSDHALLNKALQVLNPGAGQGFEEDRPAPPKAHPIPADRSLPTIRNTTSSTPIAGWKLCVPSRSGFRTYSRRNP